MVRFNYDAVTGAGYCRNHPDRPAVSYVSGQGFCQDCLGRGKDAPQFRPPASAVGTPPNERFHLGRQMLTDTLMSQVDRIAPKLSVSNRSVIVGSIQSLLLKVGDETGFVRQLMGVEDGNVSALRELVGTFGRPTAEPKQASEPQKTAPTQTVVTNSGIPCDVLFCENVAAYVSGKPLIAGKSLCIKHAFADDPQAVLALTEQQREYFGRVGAGSVPAEKLDAERRRRMGRGQPRRPGAFKYHESKPGTNAEYQRAQRAKVKRSLAESKKQPGE